MTASGRFQGKIAIVTGGSSGIGRAICLLLAREGASVVVVGRDRTRVDQTVAEIARSSISQGVLGLQLDVGSEEDIEEMRRQTLERFGQIDILVASAGIMRATQTKRSLPYSVATMPVQEWDEVIGTNLRGVFLSNRAVLPTMLKQQRGWIVNIASSRGGLYGNPYASAYCASKFGVIGLSEALAEEVSASGIKVYVVLPDVVDTPILGTVGKLRLGAALSPSRVADLVGSLLTLPDDMILVHPLVAPFLNPAWPRGLHRVVS
jgi:NAD(P)-dependent dehydrogenase (short-subunit alcohol dehydrogenase family)